ncbi:hypothetical protein [Halobaculum sp. EA56]|uniref:hypothetical protein n=1 Tax=Halobaculum sp. EA56 TaxID=3421648 RepID=UPI003EB9B299
MSLPRRVTAAAARALRRRGRALRRTWAALADRNARPAVLYLLALAAAGASFVMFLLGDGGTPDGVEFGLLMGSFGMVLYMSLQQAGTASRRGR